jgi:hypothetical protein
MKNHGWVELRDGWHITGIDSRDDGQTITSPVVAVDRDRQLAQTKSGSIYHVPGPWPDLDLPAMRGEVREWTYDGPPDRRRAIALVDYLTAEVGGTWTPTLSWAKSVDILPGVSLVVFADGLAAHVAGGSSGHDFEHPTAKTPKSAAEALRDLPALRAWLLSELDAARAVVGGAK